MKSPRSVRIVPAAIMRVTGSFRMIAEKIIVITGTRYMKTLVFTAPRTFTEKFHVTKQSADAPKPRYRRFSMFFISPSAEKSKEASDEMNTGSMNIMP